MPSILRHIPPRCIPHHLTSSHTTPHHLTPPHIASHHLTPHHTILHHTTLSCTIYHHIILCLHYHLLLVSLVSYLAWADQHVKCGLYPMCALSSIWKLACQDMSMTIMSNTITTTFALHLLQALMSNIFKIIQAQTFHYQNTHPFPTTNM